MSWKDAQDEAQRWLDTLQLPRDLSGQSVDLRAHTAKLAATGDFRRMVLEAARRKLVKKKAREIIFE